MKIISMRLRAKEIKIRQAKIWLKQVWLYKILFQNLFKNFEYLRNQREESDVWRSL
jgi:hypothetical protein